jgi:glutamate racemase
MSRSLSPRPPQTEARRELEKTRAQPVGVFDSGFGGLSVLRELRKTLPELDCVYFGDNGRAPYGGRDLETVLDFSEQCVELLFAEGCRVVVVACHTVSSVALRHLQQRYAGADRRVLGVTIPAAENAVAVTQGHIGFVGTARTVGSHTFTTEVRKLNPAVRVSEVAAPLLAPIVEDNCERDEIARLAVQKYVAQFSDIDTLVLGCTHYPLLREVFEKCVAPGVRVLDPAPFVAARFADWLARHPEFSAGGSGSLRLLSSGDANHVGENIGRYLQAEPPHIEHVSECNGRLAFMPNGSEPTGQFVRALL